MSRQQQPDHDGDYGWDDTTQAEYEAYLDEQNALPPYKRDGYAETMACKAEYEEER